MSSSKSKKLTQADYPKVYLYRRIVQAKLYIDAHFAEDIDLSDIAGEACFSKHHFLRLFKSLYGTTPQHYRKRLRVEKAAELLTRGMSVTETCFAVGFESLGSFSATFKAQMRVSPSAYRRGAQQRQASLRREPLSHVPGCLSSMLIGEK